MEPSSCFPVGFKSCRKRQYCHSYRFYSEGEDFKKSGNSGGFLQYGKEGHFSKDCPRKGSKKGSGNKSTGGGAGDCKTDLLNWGPPKHKSLYCAIHKETADHYCVTWSCLLVKYTAFETRIKGMKEN